MKILRRYWYKLTKKSPADMPSVQYWKTQEAVAAKITKAKDGSLMMQMEGEKHPFPTFPRGHLLFGVLSKLKHEIKNQVFNESWAMLEKDVSSEDVVRHIKGKLFKEIADLAETMKYEMLPTESMTPSVREIHRAWTKVAPERTYPLRDYLCFILQEDDGYRMRAQWLVNYFGWFFKRSPVRKFKRALDVLEHAEVIGDMKGKIRLLRRVLMACLEDPAIKDLFEKFCKEVDWKKVKLTEADKYHFRGKYFKVDFDLFEY
jgi:hypothetical protein